MTSFEGMTAMQAGNHLTSTEWKRIRKESAKVKKRIPDDDIRRRLAPIFADAYNKCDASLFDQLLVKYSIPDCVVVYKYAGGNNPYGVNYAEIIGREAVVAFWDTLFCSIPDAIFELHETKIRLLSTDFCSIGCKFVFTGTKLFRMSTDDLEAVKYSRDGKKTAIESACKALNQSEASASTTSSTSPVPVPVDVSVDSQSEAAVKPKDVTLGPTLDQSIDVTLIGTLTFFVNPEKQIYKFEFIHCVKQ